MEEFGWDILAQFSAQESGGCGFRTVEQAKAWFSRSERHRLERLGYRLVSLEVDRVIAESPRQLVFARTIHPFTVGALIVPWQAAA